MIHFEPIEVKAITVVISETCDSRFGLSALPIHAAPDKGRDDRSD